MGHNRSNDAKLMAALDEVRPIHAAIAAGTGTKSVRETLLERWNQLLDEVIHTAAETKDGLAAKAAFVLAEAEIGQGVSLNDIDADLAASLARDVVRLFPDHHKEGGKVVPLRR